MPTFKFEDDFALQVCFHLLVCKTIARMGASSYETTTERI